MTAIAAQDFSRMDAVEQEPALSAELGAVCQQCM